MHIEKVSLLLILMTTFGMAVNQDPLPDVTPLSWRKDKALIEYAEHYRKYHVNQNPLEPWPVIGVLTQPVVDDKKDHFHYDQYVLEANKDFVQMGGSYAVPIRYDLGDQDLYELLDKLNGVLFTGGNLLLLNTTSGEQHQYYKTARKIYEYSKRQKDQKNDNFLIFGVCQGYELLAYLACNDYNETLSSIVVVNENRPVHWEVDPKKESRIFADFRQDILDKMS
jgi:gamma-glutamyl hydrolase